jgi:hypothetical protein
VLSSSDLAARAAVVVLNARVRGARACLRAASDIVGTSVVWCMCVGEREIQVRVETDTITEVILTDCG